jgi:glycosyltransferase involved in cell wall biosynthesis
MVHLTGAVDQEALSNIMRICDVSLLTSAFEGMPRSVLEALACGLPVATTNVGEVNKIVRNNFSGFVSENRDPEIICDSVIKILRHQENFKTEHCVKSIKDYTAEIVLNKIYSEYEKL